MKKKLKTLQIMIATLFIVIMSQGTVFAAGSDDSASSAGLSAVQIIGGVILVVLAIVLPSVRGSRKETYQK